MDNTTPAFLTGILSGVLAFLLNRAPRLSTWYQAKSTEEKQIIVSILLVLIAVSILLWDCLDSPLGLVACLSATSWKTWIATLFATLTSQPVHQLTKKSKQVRSVQRKGQRRKRAAAKPRELPRTKVLGRGLSNPPPVEQVERPTPSPDPSKLLMAIVSSWKTWIETLAEDHTPSTPSAAGKESV